MTEDISTDPPTPYQRILQRLEFLYGAELGPKVARRIFRFIETHKQLRKRSVIGPYWTHEDVVLITYGDTIQSPELPPLQTLKSFLDQNLPEEFSMLHMLPFFPWSSDDGFSITDFRSVNPALGNWKDIAALEESYDLVIDLVLNHCSRENLWFIDYIAGDEPACHYFIEVDQNENLSMITRPRSSPVLSGVRTHDGMKYVWTTFSNDQIDLNYKNPDVLLEIIDILLYYFRRGARMVRLDAVAYLWKEIGTSCIHLPQTHEVIRLFRDVLEVVEPGALIMTETNVPHDENITYFGNGNEAHVIYQFSLPPLLLHAIHSGQTMYLMMWAKSLEIMDLPVDCTFFNFTASHDGVGLRPLEGLVPADEIHALLDAMRERGGYISTRKKPDGSDSPYELNISYFDAFRNPDQQQNYHHIPKFLLSQVFTLSFKGIPAVYIHSLFATPNDQTGVERTGMTRSINRRKWDRSELETLIENRTSECGQVFNAYRRLLNIRRQQPAFHPDAAQHILNLEEGAFALLRTSLDQRQQLLAIYNFTDQDIEVPLSELPQNLSQWKELICATNMHFTDDHLALPPYAACWFSKEEPDDECVGE
jgi:sucrose phosphorylase